MNIVVEKQPKCVATLRVEIPVERVDSEHARIAKGYTSKVRIPGFRPGKAPRAVVEKRFQKEIAEEVQEALFEEAYDAALKQESLHVLDFGVPEDVTTHADGSITFVSTLTLAPEVTLPEYKGVSVTVPPYAVPDEEIDAQLTALQERFADFNPIEGRSAAMGDFAVIDYVSTVDGQPTEEFLGKAAGYLSAKEDFWVRLDEKAFLPGFAAQLAGMNPGDSREITITLPEDFTIEELRSKELVFRTTSIEEIKGIIRDNMEGERRRKIDDMKVDQIVAHFNAQVDFELPENLVNQETQSQADAMVKRGVQSGMSEGEIQSQQEEIFASAGYQAVANLRTNFILQEIARVEKITVSDQELASHLMQIADSRKIAMKKFFKDMQRSGRIPNIRSSMLIGKTIDFLVEHASVAESTETTLDA